MFSSSRSKINQLVQFFKLTVVGWPMIIEGCCKRLIKEENLMDSCDEGGGPMDARPSDIVEQGSVAEIDRYVALLHPGG